MGVHSKKSLLRSRMLAERRALSANFREEASRAIARLIEELPNFNKFRVVGLYAASFDEVDTLPIVDRLSNRKTVICFPKVSDSKNHLMTFYKVDNFEQMRPGFQGILEPEDGLEEVTPVEIDCCCVPAVAFDKVGNRLGRGAGYYDRWLATYPGVSIGLAFGVQLVDDCPVDKHDYRLNWIVTEMGLIKGGAAV